jgi:hypothetical protein
MIRGSILLIATALATANGSASALAGSSDVARTQRYIQANFTLVQAASTKLRVAEATLQTLRRKIGGECPKAAVESPQNVDSEQLSNEIIGAMVIAAYHTGVSAGANFVRVTEGLRWSNHKLTSTIQSYTGKLRVLSTLAAPNVCADVRAWVASGYRTLPASTVRFDQQFMPNWVAIGELPARLLTPYERPGETAVLRRTNQLEARLTDFEAGAGVEIWSQIMDTLVLQP